MNSDDLTASDDEQEVATRSGGFFSANKLAWLVGLFMVIQALLAAGVPWLLKEHAVPMAAKALHREISVDTVRWNPFTLELLVRNLRISEPDQGEQNFIKLQGLGVNLSLASLWRLAPVLDALHIVAPEVNVVRIETQRFNISDLLEDWTRGPPPDPRTPPARFAIHDLQVSGGAFHYFDRTQDAHHALENIQFTVPFVASFAGELDTDIKPLLSAQVHGGVLRLGAQTKPFKSTRETTLHMSVKDLNLVSALKGLPALAPWQLDSGTLSTEWQLTLRALEAKDSQPSVMSVQAKGQIYTQQVHVINPQGDELGWDQWALGSNQISLELHPDGPRWTVGEARFELEKALFHDTKESKKLLSLGSLKLAQGSIDSTRKLMSVGAVQWDGLALNAQRYSDSSLNIDRMLQRLPKFLAPAASPALAQGSTHSAVGSVPDPTDPSAAWQIDIAQLSLRDGQAAWRDEAMVPVLDLGLKGLQGDIRGLSTKADADIAFKLQGELAQGGTLNLQGQALAATRQLRTSAKLQQLDLRWTQPFISESLRLRLSKGQLDAQGQWVVDAPTNGDLRLSYQGGASIAQLETSEPVSGDDFVRWKRLAATNIDVQIAPLAPSGKDSIRIGNLSLEDLFAKVVVHKTGRLNLYDILRLDTDPAASQSATPARTERKAAPRFELGEIKISGGRLSVSDQFVQPSYAANITDLQGTIGAMGSQGGPAPVALQGRVEGDAPLSVEGSINLLQPQLFLDLVAKAQGIELPSFSPYAAKYTGYPIERGKLSLDVSYKIEGSQLVAQNSIFLDQLTFGEKVEGSTNPLPVNFALSLLKNGRGEIDLRLPVTGSLNDPQFSMGGVLLQALGNLFERAITAPFSLLASVFSGVDGDLGQVEFVSGTAVLTEPALERLSQLSIVLLDRPALKLDITAYLDPQQELGDLRRLRLMSRLQDERRQKAPANDPLAAAPTSQWSPAEYAQWVQSLFESSSVPLKPRNALGIAKKIPLAEMEALLLSSIQVPPDELQALAQARATAVRQVLVKQVTPERVFTTAPVMVSGNPSTDAPGGRGQDAKHSCRAACAAFALR